MVAFMKSFLKNWGLLVLKALTQLFVHLGYIKHGCQPNAIDLVLRMSPAAGCLPDDLIYDSAQASRAFRSIHCLRLLHVHEDGF